MSDAKLLAVYDTLEARIKALKEELSTVQKAEGPQGERGPQGPAGKAGKDGRDGKDGKNGKDGLNGKDGKDGKDGSDGISIVDVSIDFDSHLRVTLSDGEVVDAGEIQMAEMEGTRIIGFGGAKKDGDSAVYIQDTQPIDHEKYLWVQTNVNNDPNDFTLWYYVP